MLEKIVGLFDSAYWWFIAFAFGVLSGWYVTSTHYDEQIAQDALNAAVARAEQGKRDYAKVIDAQNALDAARRRQSDTAAEFARLRQQLARREQRDSADACRMERAAATRCENLLRESQELLAEGSELLERNAAVHDALGAVK